MCIPQRICVFIILFHMSYVSFLVYVGHDVVVVVCYLVYCVGKVVLKVFLADCFSAVGPDFRERVLICPKDASKMDPRVSICSDSEFFCMIALVGSMWLCVTKKRKIVS